MINKRPVFWLGVIVSVLVFLYLIRSVLLPFVLGIFTAYFLDPAADRLEKWGLSRGLSTLVITVMFFLCIGLISLLVVPVIATQLIGLLEALPGYVAEFQATQLPRLSHWIGELPPVNTDGMNAAAANLAGALGALATHLAGGVFQSGMVIINLLSLILITPVVAFYLLRDWDRLVEKLDLLLPRAHAETIRQQLVIIDATLAGFVRGQLNVCLFLAAYYAIALSLVGLKFGIVIGIITGFLVIFPYIGAAVGFAVGITVALFQFSEFDPVAIVFGIFVSGQVIEGYLIAPKFVGERVGLHPVWIIFGMLAGATLFGFTGVLLAVPVTAVIGVLIRFAIDKYLTSEYYRGDTGLIEPLIKD